MRMPGWYNLLRAVEAAVEGTLYRRGSRLGAALLLLMSFGIAFYSWHSARNSERLASLASTLRPITADQLNGAADGTEALATGWVAGPDWSASRRFVFYDAEVRQKQHGRNGDYLDWEPDHSQDYHPSFLLRQNRGALTVIGNGYTLEGMGWSAGSPGFDTMDAPEGARRYCGCYPGEQVTVIGTVSRSSSPGLRAELVYKGTPEDLAAFEKRSEGPFDDGADAFFAMGAVFLVVFLVFFIASRFQGRGDFFSNRESDLSRRMMDV
ncbi:MAG TPA: hypothetical protein VFJ58_03395 [Armatimonadota bacterium]|nr:hypothetical protein [Armatimonadota bacterium]